MPKNRPPLLLDTHCWLWIQKGGDEFSSSVVAEIEHAGECGALLISAMSVWELSMLAAKNRVILQTPLLEWVREALKTPGLALVPLSPEIAVDSTQLPGQFHGDPADRIIVATARYTGATLLTRDRGILSYSKQLHVRAIAA